MRELTMNTVSFALVFTMFLLPASISPAHTPTEQVCDEHEEPIYGTRVKSRIVPDGETCLLRNIFTGKCILAAPKYTVITWTETYDTGRTRTVKSNCRTVEVPHPPHRKILEPQPYRPYVPAFNDHGACVREEICGFEPGEDPS